MAGGTNTGDGTHGSYSKVDLKVSETEPVNPTDGLLWYDPTPCATTTTTTIEVTTTTTTTEIQV